jgi:Zinc carboxypeptidase
MHGNEVVGTNVLTYLIEIFSKSRGSEKLRNNETEEDRLMIDSTVARILSTKVLIIIPMANPYGYFHDVRVKFLIFSLNILLTFMRNGIILIQTETSPTILMLARASRPTHLELLTKF